MSMHLFKVKWLVFVSKQTERLMQLQFKGPNYKPPFGALGEVVAVHFHHVAVFFPERESQGATASGFMKYGSVPDFSSLLIFKWNEKTPKPFSFGHSKKNSRGHLSLFSHSVVSDSLRPHGLQHTSLPYPSPSSGVCSNICPLSG